MCGIAGVLSFDASVVTRLDEIVQRMANRISHRGPDDSGAWVNADSGIALGHRRLSVVDLSPAGHQPMQSADGRFVLVLNGEIYNHAALRAELRCASSSPGRWQGHSDTETLLAGIGAWGIEATLERAVGMFAIALWDRSQRKLTLARDRFGEKPLYYGWIHHGRGTAFAFASELKALRAFPGFSNPVSRQALLEYMRFSYVPAPRSIYEDIYKLEPGCLLQVNEIAPVVAPGIALRPPTSFGTLAYKRWYALRDVILAGEKCQLSDEAESVALLDQTLANAVEIQSQADVPLGAFLSGGIDSSTIVALMQSRAGRRVKTFTVGFEEAAFDESRHARAVAEHLGTDHHELYVTAADCQRVVTDLPTIYDEPFADSSQIATHLVCRAARQHVVVALSGDAGDEMFGGYNRYFWGPRIWDSVGKLPFPIRRALGSAISRVSVRAWDALGASASYFLGRNAVVGVGDKAHKVANCLNSVRSMEDLYVSLVSEWRDPAEVVRADGAALDFGSIGLLRDGVPLAWSNDRQQLRMMYYDCMTYLPDDILCKVDRAAMAIGLETRVPFLDPSVVELAWRLPLKMKVRDGQGKWALRKVLESYVPNTLIDRPKAGFSVPIGDWLRGSLRPWAEDLLSEKRIRNDGFFHAEPVRRKWAEHVSGRRNHTASLWTVLMYQAWWSQLEASR